MQFISVLLNGGLIAFSTYQVIQIVRVAKERKKAKSEKKENVNENGRNSGSWFNN